MHFIQKVFYFILINLCRLSLELARHSLYNRLNLRKQIGQEFCLLNFIFIRFYLFCLFAFISVATRYGVRKKNGQADLRTQIFHCVESV